MPVPYGKKIGITRVLNELARRNRYPISCMANITWRCNFRCRHCYQAKRRGKELPAWRWEEIFDDLASAGVLLLTLSGGEPLVKKEFFEIARAARRRRFSLKLKTNAWLLDRRAADFLEEVGFEQVQISLYSTRPEVHDRVTGASGSLGRIMDAVRLLRERKISVHLSMPVMSLNAREIPKMVDLARRHRCDYAVDPTLVVCNDGSCSPASLRASRSDLAGIFRDPRLLSSSAYRKEVKRRARRIDEPVCNVGKSSFVIDPSGDVRPCAMLPFSLGNLTERSIRDIWDSSRMLKTVRGIRWADLPACRECDLRSWCARCHGNALIEDGGLFGPSTIACKVAAARKIAVEIS